MAHRLIWSTRAKAEIREIAKYIERDSKANADTMVGKLIRAARRLRRFPLSGRVVPEWNQDLYRDVIVYPYRVVYKVSSEAVAIVTIMHGRRSFPRRPPRVRF